MERIKTNQPTKTREQRTALMQEVIEAISSEKGLSKKDLEAVADYKIAPGWTAKELVHGEVDLGSVVFKNGVYNRRPTCPTCSQALPAH